MGKIKDEKGYEGVILEKIAIMIELMMVITNCSYSDAYNVIEKSKVYKELVSLNYGYLHDSPQANLSSIGQELREANIELGNKLTDENIVKAVLMIRERNLELA